MTVPFPLDAFDHAQPVRARRGARGYSRLIGIAITVAIHVVLVAAMLTAVDVGHLHMERVLTVRINLQKPKPTPDIAPPPRLVRPTAVFAPPPDVVIETQPARPVITQQAPAAVPPAPPAPIAAQHATGEVHESFSTRLLAQLNRFKQYPRAARQAHIEGTVMLHFVMDRDGKVLRFEIAQSSGRPVLDAEALALIQRAQPLPAMPADMPGAQFDAIVPINFSLNS